MAAVERVIADVERGFNTNDAELLVEHFAENASAVTVTGAQVDGRATLLETSRTGLAGPLRDQRAAYVLADVTFVRPDVAVAHTQARAVGDDGRPVDLGHTMSALYVLVKQDGRWWIVARRNTLVSDGNG